MYKRKNLRHKSKQIPNKLGLTKNHYNSNYKIFNKTLKPCGLKYKKPKYKEQIDYGKRTMLISCALLFIGGVIKFFGGLFENNLFTNNTKIANCDDVYNHREMTVTNEEQIIEIKEIANVINMSDVMLCLEEKHIKALNREVYDFNHKELKKYENRFIRLPYLKKILKAMHTRIKKNNPDKYILKTARRFFWSDIMHLDKRHGRVSIDNPIRTEKDSSIKWPQEKLLKRVEPSKPIISNEIKQAFLSIIQGENYEKPKDATDPTYKPSEVPRWHPKYDLVQFQKKHCNYTLVVQSIFYHLPLFYETVEMSEAERKARIKSRKSRKRRTGREIEIDPEVTQWVTKKMENKSSILDDLKLKRHYVIKNYKADSDSGLTAEQKEEKEFIQLLKGVAEDYGKEIYDLSTTELKQLLGSRYSKKMVAFIQSLRPKKRRTKRKAKVA